MSWSCWKNWFNLDPAVLGKRIIVQDQPVTVVGVLPRGFFGLQVGFSTDVWLPRSSARLGTRTASDGTLKPGVSLQQARAEMTVLYQFTIEERSRNAKDPLAAN